MKGIALVLATSLFYGLMPAVTQLSFKTGLSIETMLSNRYLIALAATWAYIFATRADFRVTRKQLALLLAVGVSYIGVALFINMSYLYLPGAMTSILVFMYVSMVVLMEIVSGREKPKAMKLLCVGISLAGLVMVVYDPSGAGALSVPGILLALAAGTCYAIYAFALGGTVTKNLDSIVLIGYILIIPTIAYIVRCWQSAEPMLPESFEQVMYILALAMFCTFIGSVLFCKAVKLIGSGNASIINTVEPVIAYFGGLLLLGDTLNLTAIIGGCIIIAAIILLNISDGIKESVFLDR